MSRAIRVQRAPGRARWAAARRAPLDGRVSAWALLSTALSNQNRVSADRPDVDSAVQLATQLALSERRNFRYNPE